MLTIAQFLVSLLLSLCSMASASSFVSKQGNSFALDGSPFIAVGPNAFWLGLKQDPFTSYPTHAQIEEAFIVAGYMSSTVIRSHTLGITTGTALSLRPSHLNAFNKNRVSLTGSNVFNNAAWETIDYAFTMAEKYNIKLVIPLTDAYAYYEGNYGDYCISRGVSKVAFFTDQGVRADFKDAIFQYLNHVNQYSGVAIKDSPALFLIELGNELGNFRPASTSTAIPTRNWLTDIAAYIKTIDSNHLILDPTDEALGSAISQDFSVTQLDVYSSHFYYNEVNRMTTGVTSAVFSKSPYVIGEFGSGMGNDFFAQVERLKGIKGSMFWSLHPHVNGIAGGAKILHNDGYGFYRSYIYCRFSVHYPEDKAVLLRITNHFQRMRGIAVTASIGPGNQIVASITNKKATSTSSSQKATSSSKTTISKIVTATSKKLSATSKATSTSTSISKSVTSAYKSTSTSRSATKTSSSTKKAVHTHHKKHRKPRKGCVG